MKSIAATIMVLGLSGSLLFAQSDVDALRYSRTTFGGSARYMAMSGAFGALGADFSTLSSNPAGIGLYKKSEFVITPAFYFGETESKHYDNTARDTRHNFNLSNVGMVFTSESSGNNRSVVKNLQFGLGLNRLNNFNNRILISGNNPDNSIIDTYVDDANGYHWEDIEQDYYGDFAFDLFPAWWSYLLDTISGYSDQYYSPLKEGGGLYQRKEINSWGSMNEFLMSLGANIDDRLYLGGTLSFPFIRYFEQSNYYEIDENNEHPDFNKLQLNEDLSTKGTGFNMKFGMIARATNWLRLGGAIHSPTWYNNMRDSWYNELYVEYDDWDTIIRSPAGISNPPYKLETPWRAIGSLSFVISKFALISADYEYVDYSQSKLRGRNNSSFYNENAAIQNKYTPTQNIRLGAEFRFGHFSLRGGYAIYGSPFDVDINGEKINDGEKIYYTGGLGFRDKNFFVDLAYVHSISNEDYYLYGSQNVFSNPVSNKLTSNNFLMTIGFRY